MLLEHELMSSASFFFRKDIFWIIQETPKEQKDQKRGERIEQKQADKDKTLFLYENGTFERWWRCTRKAILSSIQQHLIDDSFIKISCVDIFGVGVGALSNIFFSQKC